MFCESAKAFVNGCNAITESNHFTVVGDDSSCELIVNFDKTKNLDMVRVPVQVVEGGEVEKWVGKLSKDKVDEFTKEVIEHLESLKG